MRLSVRLLAACSCLLIAGTAGADSFYLSTLTGSTLGGISILDGDIADYDTGTDTASLFFDETLFGANENIDGISVLSSGNVVLTTTGAATLGGLGPFSDGDLVEYDPLLDVATLFFNENNFDASGADIDAVHVNSDGSFLISTDDIAQLDPGFGLGSFNDGDIVLIDGGTATLIFDESVHFADDENIDALSMLADGRLVISTTDAATLGSGLGALSFSEGDLVAYDPVTMTATMLLQGSSVFSGAENIDAASVPEPGTAALLGLGLLGLACASRRRR